MRVWTCVVIFIVLVAGGAVAARFLVHQSIDPFHALLAVFLAVNILVCYWELCLFWRRGHVEARLDHWRGRVETTGISAARAYMTMRMPRPTRFASPTFWSDIYAAYATYDPAYVDRGSCGFNIDVANGFWTLLPSILLLANYSSPFLPATVGGFVGMAIFYQWIYVTLLYVQSFFVAGRQASITRAEVFIYIWTINLAWILCAIVGLYVSINLVLDGHYGVLGLPAS